MLLFFLCVGILILGYVIYGALVERVFGSDPSRPTPAMASPDGVDFVPMPGWKVFLVQLLNIAGLGPVFGPILGALYGPAALIWIVAGAIFAGGVHDYFSGMLSVREQGRSVPDVVGNELGPAFRRFMLVFSVVLLLLVGVVFVLGPAKLLSQLLGLDTHVLVAMIFCYYFLATILPVDKLIGRLYPLFGLTLLFMAVSLPLAMIWQGYDFFPQLTLANLHPEDLPLWPLMFITIACGALSGFHATQSPLMARCLGNERHGRRVFYGAMICEGIVALVWATVGMSFFGSTAGLDKVLAEGGPAHVVNHVSTTLLGPFGGFLAILGVVLLPVTSGDTAFRATRLIIADFIQFGQRAVRSRLIIALPLFAVGFAISLAPFAVIWRYFGWANQALATIVLWSAATWLIRRGKCHWLASLPATFMTAVVVSYLAYAKIGFRLPLEPATGIGAAAAALSLLVFLYAFRKSRDYPALRPR